MGEVVALRRKVHAVGTPLERIKPAIDVSVAVASGSVEPPNHKRLPVQHRRNDALQVRHVDEVHNAKLLAKEEGTVGLAESRVHAAEHVLEALAVRAARPIAGAEAPLAPPAEELALETEEAFGSGKLVWILAQQRQRKVAFGFILRLRERVLKRHHDALRIRHQLAVEFDGRQEPIRDLIEEAPRLGSVAAHVDLLDAEGDALLLEKHPSFLAVWAPCCRIAVERHPDVLGLRAEEAHLRVRVRPRLARGDASLDSFVVLASGGPKEPGEGLPAGRRRDAGADCGHADGQS
mmetsp:Transcript_4092/g.11948  ORF Transcript_4092/g.11948 Transcript_4092/m.11948 type:complete len:292 (+) Transcript_4092:729-1604(+)